MAKLKAKKSVIVLILLLFQLIFIAIGLPTPAQAQTATDKQSIAGDAVVDPANGNLWLQWARGDQTYFSEISPDGQVILTHKHASAELTYGKLTILPGGARYYYGEYQAGVSGTPLKSFAYLSLDSGFKVSLKTSFNFSGCDTIVSSLGGNYFRPVYSPLQKRLYIPCGAGQNDGRSLIIDTASDTITGLLPYVILGINGDGTKLYANKTYLANSGASYSDLPYFDLITLDAKTEQPIGQPLMTKVFGPYAYMRSFLVNSKTGYIYALVSSCFAKCTTPLRYVFDNNGSKLEDFKGSLTEVDSVLNEASNQLYGPRLQNVNREFIAVDGRGIIAGQLAGFYWTPLAADSNRNLLYAVDNRGINANGYNYDRGLGVLVMDGKNYDVTRFIQIQAPASSLTDKAKRLDQKPAGFKGWYFPETGHTLGGKFLEYWLTHGALPIFGYPITEEFEDYNPDDGKIYIVQYFERNRFEYHPENKGTPYEVELGLLGRNFSAQTGPAVSGNYNSGETEPIQGGLLFRETGHTLTGKFLEYWQANGGLAQFGLPVTETFQELSPIDGKTYTVQYFERNRFEYHPENAGTKYEVLLGLLGTQVLRSRAWPV